MERISERQLMLIGGSYIMEATLISLPAQIIGVAQQDSWISYFFPMFLMIGVLYLAVRTLNRFPDQDLFEALVGRWKYIGRLLALLYILFFFLMLTRDLRMTIDFVNNALLLNTPLIVVGVLTVFTLVMIARGGVEILARMTDFFFPLLILVVISIPLTLFKEFDPRFVQPFLAEGFLRPLEGAWLALPYIGEIIVVLFLGTSSKIPFRRTVMGLIIGTVLLEILIVSSTLVLGTHLSARMMYPNHEMIRQIRLTDFLDRFDLLLVAIYLPSLLIKLSITLYVICHGFKRILPSVSAKDLAVGMGALALSCSFFFYENAVQILMLNYTWPYIGLLFQVFLPALFFAFLRPKKKQDEEQKEEEAA